MSRDYDWDDDEPFVVIERKSGGLGSFLLGIAVGAGIALLFAPQSGEETRRGLARSARRARRVATDAVGNVSEVVTDTFESARQEVEDRIDRARESLEVKREQVQRAVKAGREAATQARADLERRLAETKAAYNAGAQVAREGSRLSAVGSRPKATKAESREPRANEV